MIVYPISLIIISRNPLEKLQAGTWIFYSILAVLTGSLSTPGTMFSCCYSDNAYIKAHLKESLNPRKDELTCRTGHDNNNVLEDIVASKHLLVPFRKQISFALINIFPFFFMFSFFFFFFVVFGQRRKMTVKTDLCCWIALSVMNVCSGCTDLLVSWYLLPCR